MQRRFSFVADRQLAREIEALAREYDLSTEEVLRQLVGIGLDEIERNDRAGGAVVTDKGGKLD